MNKKPSVGDTVHYTHGSDEHSKECVEAVITEVADDGSLTLADQSGNVIGRGVSAEELDDKIEPGPSGRTVGTSHQPEERGE